MKIFTTMLCGAALLGATGASAQTLYDNFENTRLVSYPVVEGTLVQTAANPGSNTVNTSATCASYTRSAEPAYAIIAVKPNNAKMADVAAYIAGTKRMTIKFRSPAVGVRVEAVLQNGTKAGSLPYPAGKLAGEFFAVTTVANAWETLTFTLNAADAGNKDATVTSTDIDQMVFQVAPGTATTGTFYFDDIMGPELINTTPTAPTTQARSQLYDNFDGTRAIKYVAYKSSGGLDRNFANPAVGPNNPSARVASYTRSTNQFDALVVHPIGAALADVTSFKNNSVRMTMKVYSPAAGILFQISLQDSTVAGATNYPAGRNSEYTATTTVANAWETLTFSFVNAPSGTSNTSVNEIVLLVAPNTTVSQRVYFDDWTGPSLVGFGTGTRSVKNATAAFAPIYPNPAAGLTKLPYSLQKSAVVSLAVFDNTGRRVAQVLNNQRQPAGSFSADLQTSRLAPGLYTCRLTVDGEVLSRQLSVQ